MTRFCEELTMYMMLLLEMVGAVVMIFIINIPILIWHYMTTG